MIAKSLACQPNRLRNGIQRNVAAPFLDDRFPGNAFGNLFQDVCHQYPRPAESRLPVANRGISDDKSSNCSLYMLRLIAFRHKTIRAPL
jgi:hypothetical protein